MSSVRRAVGWTVCGLALLAGFGCKEQGPDVVRLKVPRVDTPASREKDRMLAVLVTEGDKTWSFRLSGPESAVAAHEPKFDQLLTSIKFGDDPPLKWMVPEGWQEAAGGDPIRFATIKTDAKPKELEVTVVPLPKEGGAVLPNVNRWRGQLDLPPVGEKDLDELAKEIEIDGRKGTRVNLIGQFTKKGKMPAMAKARPPMLRPKQQGPVSFAFDVPAAWTQVKPKNAMIAEQFDIVEGQNKAEATIVVLPRDAGGIEDNIQSWRTQVKLPPAAGIEDLLKDFSKIDTGLGKAALVDLDNPKADGNNRLVGVIIPQEGMTIFVKLYGPSDLVGRNKDRFETFARTLKLRE